MIHHQPIARQTVVPTVPLTVLQQEELIVGTRNQIDLAALGDGLGVSDHRVCRQHRRCEPAHDHLLQWRIVRRTPAVVSSCAAIHQIPFIHDRQFIDASGSRVDIRQSETVGELMTDDADATGGIAHPQFTAGGITGDGMAVLRADGREAARGGPDVAFIFNRRLIAAIAGIDIDHLLHMAVAVPVIDGIVDLRMLLHQHLRGLTESRVPLVPTRRACLHLTVGLIGSIDVECQVQLTVRLVVEVVCHAADAVSLSVTRRIEDIMIGRLWILKAEVAVGERHQHHQLPVCTAGIPATVTVGDV